MFDPHNIDLLIRRAVLMGLVRLDMPQTTLASSDYRLLLDTIAEFLGRVRQGAGIRRMLYDYAEVCRAPLDQQLSTHLQEDGETPKQSRYHRSQHQGLANLKKISKSLPQQVANDIHNPNILVNCDSGTEGELGCKPGNIKIYQAVFAPSYGENDYKDVYEETGNKKRIVIHPAKGGKCNVSIGNPFRSVGWFFNYVSQGSKTALIRMWEIPQKHFVTLLQNCGTEWQVAQVRDAARKGLDPQGLARRVYVEMCDHKATNQFGLWTHEENGTPTEFGKWFMSVSERMVTYYDPNGTHKPNKRDGDCRPIGRLLDCLGISTSVTDRFHDLGTSNSDANGNLTMNRDMVEKDAELLRILDVLEMGREDAADVIDGMGKKYVRIFCNLLTYNDMNPQRFNLMRQYTSTGLNVTNLRLETQFMIQVHQSRTWYGAVRKVVELVRGNLAKADLPLPEDVQATLPPIARHCTLYRQVLDVLQNALGGGGTGSLFERNGQIIDALNVILRPLCSGGSSLRLAAVKTKNEKFVFPPLSDLNFEIGASHRSKTVGLKGPIDSLDGNVSPGFIKSYKFADPLPSSTQTSNTKFQLFEHEPVLYRLQDKELPLMGGISGTTRDIFRFFGSELRDTSFWSFFSVVAAFMIKNHYHSLIECYAAALQYYKRDSATPGTNPLSTLGNGTSSAAMYKHVRLLTSVPFLTPRT
ncbi:hypothetical protein [Melittangium boletus]|nr:hypothetical protein [Melittangium boletus]